MRVDPIDHTTQRYAETARGAGYFVSPFWLGLFGDAVTAYAVNKGEETVALFHLFVYKHLHKSFVISSPMSQHIGLVLLKRPGGTHSDQSEVKRIIRALADFLNKNHKDALIDFCLPANITDVQPLLWSGLRVSPKYTYRLDLSLDEDELLRGMSAERRKNIRQAAKAGYEVLKNQDPENVVTLVNQTLENAGSPVHGDELSRLVNAGGDSVFFNSVMQSGRALASAVAGTDGQTAYYLAGGHDSDAGDSLAGSYALWNLILEAKKRGCKTFDFMGSSVPSIERYFRGFGAMLTPYFRIQSAPGITDMLHKLRHKIKSGK